MGFTNDGSGNMRHNGEPVREASSLRFPRFSASMVIVLSRPVKDWFPHPFRKRSKEEHDAIPAAETSDHLDVYDEEKRQRFRASTSGPSEAHARENLDNEEDK